MGENGVIENWKKATAGTIKLDWQETEKTLGFALHKNFKDFYSRTLSEFLDKITVVET